MNSPFNVSIRMARRRRKKTSILKIVLGSIGILALIGLFFGYHYYSYIFKPNVHIETPTREFYIHSNWGFEKVSEELVRQGIIKNKDSFDWVAEKKNYPNLVKSGKYLIENSWNNTQLVDLLRSGKQIPVQVTFTNISRLSQLAEVVSKSIEPDSIQLLNAMTNELWMKEIGFSKETVSAIFIPNTYEVYWNISAEQFVQRMHREYLHFWTKSKLEKADEIGLKPLEVSILASIVEAETRQYDEMPKVAGLYLNRLKIGMRLQSDPTVVFAVNRPGLQRVYFEDLKVESPYNTYIHSGLPPGPIGFPSTRALNAVLEPYPSNYLYMCAKPDYSGYHNFANSYSDHQQYAAQYRAFLKREGIK